MKRLLITILMFFGLYTNLIYSQEIDKQILDSIYIVSLNNRFDLLLSSGIKFIESSEQTDRIKDSFKKSNYGFLNSDELFDYAYKHGKKTDIV